MSASTPRRIRMLKAGRDSFPAIEITAAAPVELIDGDHVVAPVEGADPVVLATWAHKLTELLATHEAGVRPLSAGAAPWTHWVRILGADDEDEAAAVDFIVQARGLPATEAEAEAHGLEYGELIIVAATSPGTDARTN